jgi:hypothetical protein
MRRAITTIVFVLLLVSCNLIPNPPSLGVETTLGDKNQSVVGEVGDRVDAKEIRGGINTTNIEEAPLELLVLLVLGWLLPSPNEMWRGFMKLFRRGNG